MLFFINVLLESINTQLTKIEKVDSSTYQTSDRISYDGSEPVNRSIKFYMISACEIDIVRESITSIINNK